MFLICLYLFKKVPYALSSLYLGCYADYPNQRDLPIQMSSQLQQMNIDICFTYCSSIGFSLMGLQNGLAFYSLAIRVTLKKKRK